MTGSWSRNPFRSLTVFMNCSDGIRRSRKGQRMARSEPKIAQPSAAGEARESDLRLLALSYVYVAYGNVPAIAGALSGFKPVVVAIVVKAVLKIGRRALSARVHYLIAAAAFVAIYFFHIAFPFIVL